jgi:hypothetical protein
MKPRRKIFRTSIRITEADDSVITEVLRSFRGHRTVTYVIRFALRIARRVQRFRATGGLIFVKMPDGRTVRFDRENDDDDIDGTDGES